MRTIEELEEAVRDLKCMARGLGAVERVDLISFEQEGRVRWTVAVGEASLSPLLCDPDKYFAETHADLPACVEAMSARIARRVLEKSRDEASALMRAAEAAKRHAR